MKGILLSCKNEIRRIYIKLMMKLFPSNILIRGKCLKCGQCCEEIIVVHKGKVIETEKQFSRIVYTDPFYRLLICKGHDSEGNLRFYCRYVQEGKCLIYSERPQICRNYPSPIMFSYGGTLQQDCGFRIYPRYSFSEIFAVHRGEKNENNH